MKWKNLEKAIILGSMAASVSVPVWAADQTSGPLWGEGWNGEKCWFVKHMLHRT